MNKKRKSIIAIICILSFLISGFGIYVSLNSFNHKKYSSKLKIDKENKTLYTDSLENIKILQLTDLQVSYSIEIPFAFGIVKKQSIRQNQI